MNEKDKQELAALRSLCEHDGWIVLKRDILNQIDVIERTCLDSVKAIEDLAYKKGVRDSLRTLASMEDWLQTLEENSEDDHASDDV